MIILSSSGALEHHVHVKATFLATAFFHTVSNFMKLDQALAFVVRAECLPLRFSRVGAVMPG
jgi:hypothetical protein